MTKLAVVFHYGNPAEWSFYRPYLLNAPRPHTLYATCHEDNLGRCRVDFRAADLDPDLLVVPNRGMDTGAFLLTLTCGGLFEAGHEVVLKLHTKSPQSQGPGWRRELCGAILGDRSRGERCLRLLDAPTAGMVGASRWILDEGHNRAVDRYAQSIGLPPQPRTRFVGGTMFFARLAPYARFFGGVDVCKLVSAMPQGKPPYDLSPAHCLERIFGNVIEQSGYAIVGA